MAGRALPAPPVLQAIVEHAPDALVVIDGAGIIVLVNRQTELYFGYDREELLGKPIEVLVPERFRSLHPEYRRGYFAHPVPRPMGAGLGLSLAKAFVEAHGGQIGVRSLPGQGSTFWFELPLGNTER